MNLNRQQQEAVLALEGPLIVIAGAGSGKTKMLTARVSHLIDVCKVPPYQILAVTFTNKAAAEMRERVEKNLAQVGSSHLGSPEIGTFHSFCIRLLRRELARTPFSKAFVIYDDSDQLSLIKQVQAALNIDEKSFSPKAFQAEINRAKCDALEPHELEVAPHNLFARHLKKVYEQYQKDLITNNALDFGEIICMTYRLLRDNPDLREKYQKRYRFIHVDEYQDTNRAQYLLLSILASPVYGGLSNICVVGDEDQSIYKWRGADIRNILDFELEYPGARVIKLEQNYRSTKTILKLAGHVIRNNQERREKTLWTENEDGAPAIRAHLADERAEAELVVSEIKNLARTQERVYSDFAIFYRTNAQSRQFEDVLRREKIPYQIVGGLRFYDRKEIKDILSYFKAILNSSDSISLKRIINVPARGIGKTTLDKLDQYYCQKSLESPVSFWDVVEQASVSGSAFGLSAGTAKKLAQFVQLMKKLISEQPKLMLSELYHLILDETGYVRELRKEETEEAQARIENLEEFNTLLLEFEEEQFESLSESEREQKKSELLAAFIEQSALASDADQYDGDMSAVKLMTLHSSKGLEFPVVFLVGMEEGLFPSVKFWDKSSDDDLRDDVEEERRLCYVGITRARELLYMTHVACRRIWGNVNFPEPSRFFEEMPSDLIDFRDHSTAVRTSYSSGYSGGYSNVIPINRTSGSPVSSSFMNSLSNEWMGKKMTHPEYGRGTVVGSEGSGDHLKLTIQFSGRDQRKFLLRFIASYF